MSRSEGAGDAGQTGITAEQSAESLESGSLAVR